MYYITTCITHDFSCHIHGLAFSKHCYDARVHLHVIMHGLQVHVIGTLSIKAGDHIHTIIHASAL